LVLSTGVDDPNPQPNGFFGTLSIEQGKALLAKLDETYAHEHVTSITDIAWF